MALDIAPELELPEDVVTQAMAILARRGAGKTHTASVVVEEVVKAKLPVVVIDPTGAWWGLRSSADGEKPGLPVVILGGDHGDVPLERTAGAVVAEVVVEHPGAYVLDLSAMTSRTAEQTFVADFLERLYRAKASRREALLVVVDEADVFAPQRPGPDQTRSLGAMEAIVRRGRIRGLGCLLISQRAAVLNKNVLTQTEVLVAMQTTGPQDRDAIDEWVKGNGTPDERAEVIGSLASLARGEAWVWSPAWLRILRRVHIRARQTFDSSRTPEAGEAAAAPRAFATVDLAALGERIAATVERAKADDPKVLRARIAELERQVAAKPAAVTERIEVPVLAGDELERLHEAVRAGQEALAGLQTVRDELQAAVDVVTTELRRVQSPIPEMGRVPVGPRGVPGVGAEAPRTAGGDVHTVVAARPVAAARPVGEGEARLGKAERTFLAALAQYPVGLSRTRLSLLTGYSAKSGHFSNVLGRLRALGYVDRGTDQLRITEEGIEALGSFEALPYAGPELVAYWLGRLGKAERTFLEVFVSAFPGSVGREELAERTGYSASSGHFSNVLGRLRGMGLVEGFTASIELMGGQA